MTTNEYIAAQKAELEALLAAQKAELEAQQAIAAALAAQQLEDEKDE